MQKKKRGYMPRYLDFYFFLSNGKAGKASRQENSKTNWAVKAS
jgi:hypothetical protein